MFPKLKAEALEAVFTKLSGYEGFDEELRKYPGTTEEALTKFIADANKNPKWTKHINRVWAGLTGILTNTAGVAAAVTGSDTAHDAMRVLHEQQEAFETKASLAKTGPVADFTSRVAGGATSLLPVMGSARVAGLGARLFGAGAAGVRAATAAGVTLGAAGQSFGGGYDAAVHHLTQQGVPEAMARRQALKPAVINGLVTGVLTYWGRNSGVEPFLRGQAGRELVKRTLWEQGKAMGRDYLKEFGEEGLDQLSQGFVAKMTYHPGKSLHDIFAEAWDAAAIGGVLGGGMSGAGAVSENAAAWWSGGNGASAAPPNNAMHNRAPGGIDSTGPDGDIWKPHIAEGEYGDAGSADAQAAGQNAASYEDASGVASSSTPDRFSFSNAGSGNADPFQPKAWGVQHYLKKLTAWMKGEDIGRDVIGMGPTPPVLRVAGADAHSLVVPPGLFTKVTQNEHQVPIEALEQLPQALANPVAIFQSRTQSDGIVVLTEFDEPGKGPIIAAVHLGKTAGRNFLVNEVASLYGRPSHDIANMFGEGLLYENPQKSLVWARRVGLQLPKRGTPSQGQARIPHPEDVVKWLESQPGAKNKTQSRPQGSGQFVAAPEAQKALGLIRERLPELLHQRVITFRTPQDLANSSYGEDYSPQDIARMGGAEGLFDRETGRTIVFTDQIELRENETPLRAVARVLLHERVGHEGVNFLLDTDSEFSTKWNGLASRIPQTELDDILKDPGYSHLAESPADLALEWLARQADTLQDLGTNAKLEGSSPSLARQMLETVRAYMAKIYGRFSSKAAFDLEVRELISRAREAAFDGRSTAHQTNGVMRRAEDTPIQGAIPNFIRLASPNNPDILLEDGNETAHHRENRNPARALAELRRSALGRSSRGDEKARRIHHGTGAGSRGTGLPRIHAETLERGLVGLTYLHGSEHDVRPDPGTNRAVKLTKPGEFGWDGNIQTYLQRLAWNNALFDDDIAVEGIVQFAGEDLPRLVTTQPWYKIDPDRPHPEPEEIDAYMRSKGLLKTGPEGYVHRHLDIAASDEKGINFIRTKSGAIHPVDLILTKLSKSDYTRLRELADKTPQPALPSSDTPPDTNRLQPRRANGRTSQFNRD